MAIEKIIDFRDALSTLVNDIAPKYFSTDVTQNRVSTFGYVTEALAHAWSDSIILEQNRSEDYCPELSSNEIHVRQTAKLREVGVNHATPFSAYATLYIKKSDIIEKGITATDRSKSFTIDRRSTIVSNAITYSFEHDIVVKANPKTSGGYVFSASYVAGNDADNSYIQMFEDYDDFGEEVVALLLRCRQIEYNIQEKVVTDILQFTYEGLSFDYNNLLAGFEVFYCLPNSSNYKQLETEYYLSDTVSSSILYDDDDRNILRILANNKLNIPENSMIRVEIQETLGEDGSIAVDNTSTTFTLYRDNAYNYTGINITAEIVTTPEGAYNGDDLASLRHKLIQAKMMRNNITTALDIINYINDTTANVQIIKKRNDIEDRLYYLYTLLRRGMEIAPTCTKKCVLQDEDFDYFENNGKTMVLKAGRKFSLDPETHVVTPLKPDTDEATIRYKLAMPYLVKINNAQILTYFCNALDTKYFVQTKETNEFFSYQLISSMVSFYRDPMEDENPDQYTITLTGTLNTSNDLELVDIKGQIVDYDKIVAYMVFRRENANVAYLPIKLTDYSPGTRTFKFVGSMRTNDYVTEENSLHITEGLYSIGTTTEFNSTIDYKDANFDIYIMYKTGPEQSDVSAQNTRTSPIYMIVPGLEEYTLMNAYTNQKNSAYNLLIEMNKYSRSSLALEVRDLEAGTFNYILDEVPFIEYEYARKYLVELYPVFMQTHDTYADLIKTTTDFDVSLKFINTYGPSQYLSVVGTTVATDESGVVIRNDDGTLKYIEDEVMLNNLNPRLRFCAYGDDVNTEEVYTYIYEYLRENYIIDTSIFISNICTAVENTFTNIKSIKYMGVDNYDASYQEFIYRKPDLTILDNIKAYVPEVLNVTDIIIDLDDSL